MMELDIHMRIEDDLYYPAVAAAGALVAIAHAEHRQVSDQLAAFLRTNPTAPAYEGEWQAFVTTLDAHAEEEERDLISPPVEITGEALEELGNRMLARMGDVRDSWTERLRVQPEGPCCARCELRRRRPRAWLTRSPAPHRLDQHRGGRMDARLYAKVVGVTIVLIGIGGVLLGEKSLFGVLNIDIGEDVVHLVTGALMAGVGFRGSDSAVRSVVGGLGVVYLLVAVLGFFVPDLFGLLPHEYETVLDNLIHLSLGVLGMAVGFLVGPRPVAQS